MRLESIPAVLRSVSEPEDRRPAGERIHQPEAGRGSPPLRELTAVVILPRPGSDEVWGVHSKYGVHRAARSYRHRQHLGPGPDRREGPADGHLLGPPDPAAARHRRLLPEYVSPARGCGYLSEGGITCQRVWLSIRGWSYLTGGVVTSQRAEFSVFV